MSLLAEISNYSISVIDGKEIACKKHQQACQRFLTDLDRAAKKDFEYNFDEKKAQRFIDWMGLFKHTKGSLAGTYKKPEPIEKFIYANIYGWVNVETDFRRFRQAYIQMARKQAKSQDLAILGSYECSAFGEKSAEVYIAASKRDQCRFVFEEAEQIIKNSDLLKDKFKTSYGIIRHLKSNSTFMRLSQDDRKKGDGSNPQCGILDEYHCHETDEYYNMFTSGMKTREQPLIIIITTAGYNLNCPCYRDEYQYVSKILDPNNEIKNDKYFAIICELDKDEEGNLIDDIRDEKVWKKSNPVTINSKEVLESLRSEFKIALDKPEKMRDFLTKSMNVWVNQREFGYMNLDKWKRCKGEFPDLAGENVYVGLDLAQVDDMSSVAFEFKIDGKYYIKTWSFVPENTLNEKELRTNMPFYRWRDNGYIITTHGDVVDYRFIEGFIINKLTENQWNIKVIAFDPYSATQLASDFVEIYGKEIVVAVRQGVKTLSEPTKDFRNQVYLGNVIHEDDPVLNWCIGNCIVTSDNIANIKLDKKNSKEKIDPAAAIINAHSRAMLNEEPGYNERGLRSLA